MNEYLSTVNAPELYLLVAIVLAVMTAVCFLFLIKSYRAGVKLGMGSSRWVTSMLGSETNVKPAFFKICMQ